VKFLLDTNIISEIRKRDRADASVARWVARARLSVPDPLPRIDGLLAATAKVHGLTLVTRNVADISRTGVSLLNPFSP
jgi:predicted nucleic acid-binding protein